MKRAVYAGSFDPITEGHTHVINKAAGMFDELVVVVANNASKAGFFNSAERVRFCQEALKDIDNVCVKTISDVYVVDYAESLRATHLVRGLPTVADFQYEYELYHNNRAINPKLDTVFIMCDKEVQQVRSSTVRGMVGYRGWIKQVRPLVPKVVLNALLAQHMKKEWLSLSKKVTYSQGVFEIAWEHIVSRMANRPYHNLEHIQSMLEGYERYKEVKGAVEDEALFKVAIWLHDIVVSSDASGVFPQEWTVSNAGTSEEQSANYARGFIDTCGGGWKHKESEFVRDLILATDYSSPRERTPLQNLLCQLDCAILEAGDLEYSKYVDAIKQEYAPICGEEKFREGRKEFLEKALKDGSVFRDFFGSTVRGMRAVNNMNREYLREYVRDDY